MRALTHIGMPKTGSTTIQGFLHTERARLRGGASFIATCSAPASPSSARGREPRPAGRC